METDSQTAREPHGAQRRLRSKVSRLPADIRQFINQAIEDGLTYPAIISQLNEKGHPGITPQNLSTWYYTGYQRWCRDQERAESIRLHAENISRSLQDLTPEDCAKAIDHSDLLLAAELGEALHAQDPETLSDLIAEKPDLFFKYATLMQQRQRNRLIRDQAQFTLQKRRDKRERKLNPPQRVAPPRELLYAIEDACDFMPVGYRHSDLKSQPTTSHLQQNPAYAQ